MNRTCIGFVGFLAVLMSFALGAASLSEVHGAPLETSAASETGPDASLMDELSIAPVGARRHDVDDAIHLDYAEEFPSVGAIFWPGFIASGTLVDQHWVMTAAHAVDDTSLDDSEYSFLIDEQFHTAAERVVYPGWHDDDEVGSGYDIALMRLETPVTSVTPAPLSNRTDELDRVGINVGYGVGGTGDEGFTTSAGEKRAGENMVDEYGDWYFDEWSDRLILQDFDAPADFSFEDDEGPSTTQWFGSADPLDAEYIIGPGDSGGGLFIDFDDGGGPRLAGVHSFVGHTEEAYYGMYGSIGGSVRVSQFHDWAITVIPEPTTGVLLLLAVLAVGTSRPRRQAGMAA